MNIASVMGVSSNQVTFVIINLIIVFQPFLARAGNGRSIILKFYYEL